jgi:O-methyltransferase involved in polyketide biosynthesis
MGAPHEPLGGVPLTAYLTAVARQEATQDPSSGFRDPYAARFAERCPPSILRMTRRTAGLQVLVERSVAIDSVLSGIIATGRVACVLNLGAGFDARPYRLSFDRHVTFAEVDVAALIAEKEQLLPASESPVPLRRFGCDLRDERGMGAILREVSVQGPVLALSEGLLTYLRPARVRELGRLLWRETAVMEWVCDLLSLGSAAFLEAAARATGVPGLRFHGFQDLAAVEEQGWACHDYRVLQTASLTGPSASPRMCTPASSQVLDGVVHLRRSAETPA